MPSFLDDRVVAAMAAGWNVRVTTFDFEGKLGTVRNFLAYEPDKERAVELVCKRVPVREGEQVAQARARRDVAMLSPLGVAQRIPLRSSSFFGEALRSEFWCLLWLCFGRGARFSIGRTAIV
jgi:hypothetical protein